MYEPETATIREFVTGGNTKSTAVRDQTELEVVVSRLQQLNVTATSACDILNNFLTRCGRSIGGEVAEAMNPQEIGHFGDISKGMDDLNDRLTFIHNTAERIARIG